MQEVREDKCQVKYKSNAPLSNRKRLCEAIQLFVEVYPEYFNLQSPKPLKIGIINKLCIQGKWPHSKKFPRKTLAYIAGKGLSL